LALAAGKFTDRLDMTKAAWDGTVMEDAIAGPSAAGLAG
jgi:hypothetical protein